MHLANWVPTLFFLSCAIMYIIHISAYTFKAKWARWISCKLRWHGYFFDYEVAYIEDKAFYAICPWCGYVHPVDSRGGLQ